MRSVSSCDPDILFFQDGLHPGDVDMAACLPGFERYRRCRTGSLAGRRMRYPVPGHGAAGHEKVFNPFRQYNSIWNLEISPGGGQAQYPVSVQELREDAD